MQAVLAPHGKPQMGNVETFLVTGNSQNVAILNLLVLQASSSITLAGEGTGSQFQSPLITPKGGEGPSQCMVSMSHPVEGVKIYYTLDGTDPKESGLLFEQPICLKEDATVHAVAKQGDRWSNSIDAQYFKVDARHTVKLEHKYNEQYEAGGLKALIDHQRGGENFRTGSWQGYYGVDLIATVDLARTKRINRLAGSFLQEIYSWIWMPTEVEYFVSDDGRNFRSVGKVKNQVPIDADGAFIQEMEVRPRTDARYVKMVAKTIGTCPEGHVGAGQKAWIFCDEFVIE